MVLPFVRPVHYTNHEMALARLVIVGAEIGKGKLNWPVARSPGPLDIFDFTMLRVAAEPLQVEKNVCQSGR
jgi:hypothetical protein